MSKCSDGKVSLKCQSTCNSSGEEQVMGGTWVKVWVCTWGKKKKERTKKKALK